METQTALVQNSLLQLISQCLGKEFTLLMPHLPPQSGANNRIYLVGLHVEGYELMNVKLKEPP